MLKKFIYLIIVCCGLNVCLSFAQPPSPAPERRRDEDQPFIGIRETLAKWKIQEEKKSFEELLKRSEEIDKISEELALNFSRNNQLSTEDVKKLERLEKQIKKIRDELGAEDDDDEKDKEKEAAPKDLVEAFNNLKNNADNLLKELKKISRHSISVVAIESSNALLKIVKFIRFKRN